MFPILLAAVLWSGLLAAQEINVYSEFRRVDPFGEIIPQDREGRPREILSPLMARNSHYTFRMVVTAPAGQHYYLFVGSNPENIFKVNVYKEMWQKQEGHWVPDRLIPVDTPYRSHIPDRYHGIPGQTHESFLVDIEVPADLVPDRYKLEPQITCGGRWAIYPMEVRVSDVVAPAVAITGARLPSIRLSADASLLGPLREYLCGIPEQKRAPSDTVRQIIRRNVLEDLAIAREKEKELGKGTTANYILRGLNMDAATFCAAEGLKGPMGPEWYLRGRDFLYQGPNTP